MLLPVKSILHPLSIPISHSHSSEGEIPTVAFEQCCPDPLMFDSEIRMISYISMWHHVARDQRRGDSKHQPAV